MSETVLTQIFRKYDSNAYRINFDTKIENVRMREFSMGGQKERRKLLANIFICNCVTLLFIRAEMRSVFFRSRTH